jgi:hypothetical protein
MTQRICFVCYDNCSFWRLMVKRWSLFCYEF